MLITFDYLEVPWINHQFQPHDMDHAFQPQKKNPTGQPQNRKNFSRCAQLFLLQHAPVVLDRDTNLSTLLLASLVKNKLLQTTMDAWF